MISYTRSKIRLIAKLKLTNYAANIFTICVFVWKREPRSPRGFRINWLPILDFDLLSYFIADIKVIYSMSYVFVGP